jgi:transposase-like protein
MGIKKHVKAKRKHHIHAWRGNDRSKNLHQSGTFRRYSYRQMVRWKIRQQMEEGYSWLDFKQQMVFLGHVMKYKICRICGEEFFTSNSSVTCCCDCKNSRLPEIRFSNLKPEMLISGAVFVDGEWLPQEKISENVRCPSCHSGIYKRIGKNRKVYFKKVIYNAGFVFDDTQARPRFKCCNCNTVFLIDGTVMNHKAKKIRKARFIESDQPKELYCPRCFSPEIHKIGLHYNKFVNRQIYRCYRCNKSFSIRRFRFHQLPDDILEELIQKAKHHTLDELCKWLEDEYKIKTANTTLSYFFRTHNIKTRNLLRRERVVTSKGLILSGHISLQSLGYTNNSIYSIPMLRDGMRELKIKRTRKFVIRLLTEIDKGSDVNQLSEKLSIKHKHSLVQFLEKLERVAMIERTGSTYRLTPLGERIKNLEQSKSTIVNH